MKKLKTLIFILSIFCILLLRNDVANATVGWGGPLAPYGLFPRDATYEYFLGVSYVMSNTASDERMQVNPQISGQIELANLRDNCGYI